MSPASAPADAFSQARRELSALRPSFVRLLIDTLRVDRSAYRNLHDFMVAHDWLGRSYLRDVAAEIQSGR